MNFLVFDFDGTLCDSLVHFLPAFNSLSEKYRFKPIRDETHFDALKAKSSQEICRDLDFDLIKLPFVVKELRTIMAAHIDQVQLYDAIQGEIKALRGVVTDMAILSSNSKSNIEFVLKKFDLAEYFSEISGRSMFFGKSSKMKQIKKTFLKKHGLGSGQGRFIYIGDETKDIEAAKEAGFEPVAVTWGLQKESILQAYKPNLLIRQSNTLSQELLHYLTQI